MILLRKRKKQVDSYTPDERRELYRRYFAYRMGFQAGASARHQRVDPREDYEQGFEDGQAATAAAAQAWLEKRNLQPPPHHPYIAPAQAPTIELPAAVVVTALPSLPQGASEISIVDEDATVCVVNISEEIDMRDLEDDLAEISLIEPEQIIEQHPARVTGDIATAEGLINRSLHGFTRADFDTSEFDAPLPPKLPKPPRR